MSSSSLLTSGSPHSDIDGAEERQPLAAPGAAPVHHKRAPIMSYVRLLIRNIFPLVGAFSCAASFGLCVWAIIEGRFPALLSTSSYVGIMVAMTFLFTASVKLLNIFVEGMSHSNLLAEDSNAAMICCAEVSVDSDTVLTVRSWWPRHMSQEEVRKHGKRVAMTSARRWLADNRQSGKCTKIRFTDDAALALCRAHVTTPVSAVSCSLTGVCAVCLDELSCDSVKMRHCGHLFHDSCLATWFVQSSRLQCPLCRADHNECVPAADLEAHIVHEEPTISVVSISVETGVLANQ